MKVPVGITGMYGGSKWAEVEAACSDDSSRPVLQQPWYANGNLYATDSYVAVRVAVADGDNDTTGPVPVEAIKAARRSTDPKFKPVRGNRNAPPSALVLKKGKASVGSVGWSGTWTRREGNPVFPSTDTMDEMFDRPDAPGSITVAVNVELLYRASRAMGCRTVMLTVPADTLKPIRLRPWGANAGRVALVMPIRVNQSGGA